MSHYPYAANGDPNLDLLSPHHLPFFVDDVPFPAVSSSSSDDYFIMHRSSSSSRTYPGIPDPATTQIPFCSSSSSYSSPASSACEFLDFHHREDPGRRVYSAGNLQGMNNTQVSAENCTQEGAGRVVRYSTEERKERIERYRSKRNHRNFHKKITYACRKTLADSRPRVRGRFARNGEAETEMEAESSEASYECYGHNNYESTTNGGDWLKQMQAALATADVEEERCYDEDVWASLDSVFSVNLLS